MSDQVEPSGPDFHPWDQPMPHHNYPPPTSPPWTPPAGSVAEHPPTPPPWPRPPDGLPAASPQHIPPQPTTPVSGSPRTDRSTTAGPRLIGIDVARGIALIAMMAVHMLAADRFGGEAVLAVTTGRAAALFAVLAGISVALSTGRDRPAPWAASAAAMLARAAVIGVIGMTLGVFSWWIAVILVNYALLFAAACLALRLRAPVLAGLAVVWVALAPQLSFALRRLPLPGDSPGPVPSWPDLAHPLELITNLMLTGYYPVLTWFGYLLVGMAVGRSHRLYRPEGRWSGWWLVALGAGLTAASTLAVRVLETRFDVHSRVSLPPGHPSSYQSGEPTSLYGTTPTNTWWWQLTDLRHSGTTFDLVATIGSSLVVIGCALLLTRWATARTLLWPLAVGGAMPLTIYSLHVMIESGRALFIRNTGLLGCALEAAVLLSVAVVIRVVGRELGGAGGGPLEWVARVASRTARAAVQPRTPNAATPPPAGSVP